MQLCRRPNALPPTTSRRSPATCPPRQIASTSTRYARDGTPLPAADPGRRQHRLPRRVVNLQATADLPCFLMPTGYHRTSRFLPPLGRTSANAYSKASATAAITDTFPVRLLRTDGSDGLTESDASDCSVVRTKPRCKQESSQSQLGSSARHSALVHQIAVLNQTTPRIGHDVERQDSRMPGRL